MYHYVEKDVWGHTKTKAPQRVFFVGHTFLPYLFGVVLLFALFAGRLAHAVNQFQNHLNLTSTTTIISSNNISTTAAN